MSYIYETISQVHRDTHLLINVNNDQKLKKEKWTNRDINNFPYRPYLPQIMLYHSSCWVENLSAIDQQYYWLGL